MAYTINLTNGTTLIPGGLSDGTVDQTHTSLTLIGRDYAGYGQFLNSNFVKLIENFANQSSPPNPLRGQLWWDTANNILRVYSGTSWKISTGATSAPASAPPADLSTLGGDLWYDTTNSQLKVWTGTGWQVIGPQATPATGNTGAFPALMVDPSGSTKVVVQLLINSTIYAIFSKDTFVSTLTGFSLIKPGLNFSSTAGWGINTQDVLPNPNTLALRDSNGALAVTAFNASQTITSQQSVVAPILQGSLTGNVSATTVAATSMTAASATLSSGMTGNVLTPAQPYITSLGTLTGLGVNGVTNLTGSAYLNGAAIATYGGSASFTSVNGTPVGNLVPSTGVFTTLNTGGLQAVAIGNVTPGTYTFTTGNVAALQAVAIGNVTPGTGRFSTVTASTVNAATIGNTGAQITGTIQTASQTNITGLGTITTGTWNAGVVQPTYGGTGVNNGNNTLTLNASYTLNQRIDANASPTFYGTNFLGIPNSSLINSTITVNGSGVSLGSSINVVGSLTGTSNQISASASTGAVTLSLPQNVHTGADFRVNSLGIGTTASGTTGEIRATNNITAYYSDDRLKTRLGGIENALDKVDQLAGFYYQANETAQALGYEVKREVGISAQDVERVMPETVAPAPIDEQYLTVRYERLVPLLIEAIKELRSEVNEIKSKL